MSKVFCLGLLALAGACASKPAVLWLGGDVHVGAGPSDVLAALAPSLRGVGVVNLEGPIAEQPAPGGRLRLANAEEALGALRGAGVRVLGIANNHAGDAGSGGPRQTEEAIVRARLAAASGRAALVDLDGVRVAVTAHDLSGGVPEDLGKELAAARARADRLVATFHVTGPALYLPRPELRRAAEVALASGASAVAAHGTHVLGPVERRGDAVIAWGLGNLAFACDCTREREGLVLELDLREGVLAAVVPIESGLGGAPARAARDPAATFELLEALGSTALVREGGRAWF